MATMPDTVGRNLDLDSAVDEVKARYTSANPVSQAQHERAKQSMPGRQHPHRHVLHALPALD